MARMTPKQIRAMYAQKAVQGRVPKNIVIITPFAEPENKELPSMQANEKEMARDNFAGKEEWGIVKRTWTL